MGVNGFTQHVDHDMLAIVIVIDRTLRRNLLLVAVSGSNSDFLTPPLVLGQVCIWSWWYVCIQSSIVSWNESSLQSAELQSAVRIIVN